MQIQKILGDSYFGENMRKIAHMVDEVCKKVETSGLPHGAKKEDSSKSFAFKH